MRDGRQYSPGRARYLCQMVMRRCRDTGRVSAASHLFEPQAHQPSAATHAELAIDARNVRVRGRRGQTELFRERWLSDSPKTLQEIGDSFGISRERARQLEKRMLDKLRVFLEAELGSAVDIGAMVEE